MHKQDPSTEIHNSHLVTIAKKSFRKCSGSRLKKMWSVNNATVFPDDPECECTVYVQEVALLHIW